MLTSLQNPLIKQVRKLQKAKERHSQRLFLLEGTHLLEESLKAGWALTAVCHTESWKQRYGDLWQQLAETTARLEVVNEEVMRALTTTVNPDGVVAIAPRHRSEASMPSGSFQLGLALETIQDPGNLGTIIRTAAAVNLDCLWLSHNSVDLDHPKVLRASAGQWFRLPMMVSTNLADDVQALKQSGVQVIATLPQASLTYWDLDLTRPTLVLAGNEGAGLSPELAKLADHHVNIPLASAVESLNVAIATALILYEANRQRRDH
ncbi:MAG: RNA methyltransferase [Elainellaceae cyanobacterium]